MDTAQLEPDDYVLTFTPAPSRKRVAGWTERRQRTFILLLRRTGLVAVAARGVGLSGQSAYKLRRRADAAGFAAAWDRALDDARARAFALAVERGLYGCEVASFYRDRFVRTRCRLDDRYVIAALGYAARRGTTLAKGE